MKTAYGIRVAAPPCEMAGSQQRVQGKQQQHGLRPAWTYRRKRRKRSGSDDFETPEQQRPSRRNKTLSGLLLVVVLSVAMVISFRHHEHHHPENGGGGGGGGGGGPEVDHVEARVDHEDDEVRLRREVQDLENELSRKKALLGKAPGLPLAEAGRKIGGGGGGGGSGGDWSARDTTASRDRIEAKPQQQNEHQHQQQQQQRQYSQQETPSIPKGSLAGEAMFGGLTTQPQPIRPSLESQPSLIREPVPLIVGGTDGSGTRGVVDLLERLKVPMIVEDRGTMDVHGAPYMHKGGWPMVVRPVIEWSHETSYESRGAPDGLRRTTVDALDNLKVQMGKLAKKLPRFGDRDTARHVSWGFKAPVSMVLVPFFKEAWGKAKFLHVVRDGRDIAFSGNQTPVEKFYADVFPKGTRESGLGDSSLKGMALWNRWNLGVYQWAATEKEKGASGIDYLLLHAEDLMDPDAKFSATKDVAEFVGSPLSDFELCCIATEDSKDMGSHTKKKNERGKVTNRFGKWKGKVEGNPQLSKLLHAEGEGALRTFGYEPERSLRASAGFQCPAEHDPKCPIAPGSGRAPPPARKNLRRNAKVTADVQDTATCIGLKKDMDFQGSDLKVGNSEGHLDCCKECRSVNDCSYFTFDYTSKVCYLKSGKGTEKVLNGLVSGMAVVP